MSDGNVMVGFDPAFHQPVRLQVAAVLANVQEAEFARLREIAGVADSVMSKHLSALSEAGYVALRKSALDGRQRTWAALTRTGRAAFKAHVAALQRLAGATA
ncbi:MULTISPECIES: transcriptional regulator [Sphingomonas]|uniref:transcriptional regulator n=1 Tax=Sphingomonas TaxID=13687 RepID=UPI001F07EFD0|nr:MULTISPECIES: transcriptional regulator [Sphingomonas]